MVQFKLLGGYGATENAQGRHSIIGKAWRLAAQRVTRGPQTRVDAAVAIARLATIFKQNLASYSQNPLELRVGQKEYVHPGFSNSTQLNTGETGQTHSAHSWWPTFQKEVAKIQDVHEFNSHPLIKALRAEAQQSPDVIIELLIIAGDSALSKKMSVASSYRQQLLQGLYSNRSQDLPVGVSQRDDTFARLEDWLASLKLDRSEPVEAFLQLASRLIELLPNPDDALQLQNFEDNVLAPALFGTAHKTNRRDAVEQLRTGVPYGARLVDVVKVRGQQLEHAKACLESELPLDLSGIDRCGLVTQFKYAFPTVRQELTTALKAGLEADFQLRQAINFDFNTQEWAGTLPSNQRDRLAVLTRFSLDKLLDYAIQDSDAVDVDAVLGSMLTNSSQLEPEQYKAIGRRVRIHFMNADDEIRGKYEMLDRRSTVANSGHDSTSTVDVPGVSMSSPSLDKGPYQGLESTFLPRLFEGTSINPAKQPPESRQRLVDIIRDGVFTDNRLSPDRYASHKAAYVGALADSFNANFINPRSSLYPQLGKLMQNCLVLSQEPGNTIEEKREFISLWLTLLDKVINNVDSQRLVLPELLGVDANQNPLFRDIVSQALVATQLPQSPDELGTYPLEQFLNAFREGIDRATFESEHSPLTPIVGRLSTTIGVILFENFNSGQGDLGSYGPVVDSLGTLMTVIKSKKDRLFEPEYSAVDIAQDMVTLGLNGEPQKEAVKKAYRRFMLKDHPDKVAQKPDETPDAFDVRKKESHARFHKVQQAYTKLMAHLEG
jgi:hypothetical protein